MSWPLCLLSPRSCASSSVSPSLCTFLPDLYISSVQFLARPTSPVFVSCSVFLFLSERSYCVVSLTHLMIHKQRVRRRTGRSPWRRHAQADWVQRAQWAKWRNVPEACVCGVNRPGAQSSPHLQTRPKHSVDFWWTVVVVISWRRLKDSFYLLLTYIWTVLVFFKNCLDPQHCGFNFIVFCNNCV